MSTKKKKLFSVSIDKIPSTTPTTVHLSVIKYFRLTSLFEGSPKSSEPPGRSFKCRTTNTQMYDHTISAIIGEVETMDEYIPMASCLEH